MPIERSAQGPSGPEAIRNFLSMVGRPGAIEASIDTSRRQSPVHWLRDSPYLHMPDGNSVQFAVLESALMCIESTSVGHALLDRLDDVARRKDKQLVIHLDAQDLYVAPFSFSQAINLKGSDAVFECNLDMIAPLCYEDPGRVAPEVYAPVVFSCLNSVLHVFKGEMLHIVTHDDSTVHLRGVMRQALPASYADWPAGLHEQARLCGLGVFASELFSENAFRAKINEPAHMLIRGDDYVIYDDDTASVHGEVQSLFPRIAPLALPHAARE